MLVLFFSLCYVFFRLLIKLFFTDLSAKIIGLALVYARCSCLFLINIHIAYRILCQLPHLPFISSSSFSKLIPQSPPLLENFAPLLFNSLSQHLLKEVLKGPPWQQGSLPLFYFSLNLYRTLSLL